MVTARVTVSAERPGLDVHMYEQPGPVVSDRWTVGGWTLRFVRLDAGQRYEFDAPEGVAHVKVVTGRLTDPSRVAYAAPRAVADTRVERDHVTAGPDGALVTVLMRMPDAPDRVTSMAQLTFGGPHAERLEWTTFADRFAGRTTFFDGLDAYIAPGFHLLDAAGAEIAYVYVWTAGKGVDLSTHNHGFPPGAHSPAFAEVHLVLANGTGVGGMYETSAPGASDRVRLPVPAGCEHGPYFAVDDHGTPQLRDNGAVDYPWHGWQGGDDGEPGQAYDVVVPFEITVPYARVTGA
jgi:hypothetical protein